MKNRKKKGCDEYVYIHHNLDPSNDSDNMLYKAYCLEFKRFFLSSRKNRKKINKLFRARKLFVDQENNLFYYTKTSYKFVLSNLKGIENPILIGLDEYGDPIAVKKTRKKKSREEIPISFLENVQTDQLQLIAI